MWGGVKIWAYSKYSKYSKRPSDGSVREGVNEGGNNRKSH